MSYADVLEAVRRAPTAEEAERLLVLSGCPPELAPTIAGQERGDPEAFDVLAGGEPVPPG